MITMCDVYRYVLAVSGFGAAMSYVMLFWHAMLALDTPSSRRPARRWLWVFIFHTVLSAIAFTMVYYIVPCVSR